MQNHISLTKKTFNDVFEHRLEQPCIEKICTCTISK